MLSTAPDDACEEAPLPDQAQDHREEGAPTPWLPNAPSTNTPLAIRRGWIDDLRPDVNLKLFNVNTGAFAGAATTDLQGQYVFYNVLDGFYSLYVLDRPGCPIVRCLR